MESDSRAAGGSIATGSERVTLAVTLAVRRDSRRLHNPIDSVTGTEFSWLPGDLPAVPVVVNKCPVLRIRYVSVDMNIDTE